MRQLGSIFIVACFAAAVYCGYRAIDSVAGIFDGRSDVAITEIETGGRVQIAEIQADRDVQIATINAQRDVTSDCIVARWNAYRCIEAGNVPGTQRPSPSAGQLALIFVLLFVSGVGVVVVRSGTR